MAYLTWDQVERRRKRKKVLLILLLLLLLTGGGLAGYHFYREWRNDKQQKNYEDLRDRAFNNNGSQQASNASVTPALTDVPSSTPTPTHVPTAEEMLLAAIMKDYEEFVTILPDFNILHQENEDVFAYIAIPDTIIDYPILANEVEDYYLHYNIDHTKGYPGCLYVQNCNSTTLDDPFTIVYGHNMKNGTMFGSLKVYNDEDFRLGHPYFFVYQEHRVLVYEVVVVSHLEPEHLLSADYVKQGKEWVFDKFSGHEAASMIDRIRKEGGDNAYVASPEPTDDDTLMVLSTCGEGRRFIVVGKRVLDLTVE